MPTKFTILVSMLGLSTCLTKFSQYLTTSMQKDPWIGRLVAIKWTHIKKNIKIILSTFLPIECPFNSKVHSLLKLMCQPIAWFLHPELRIKQTDLHALLQPSTPISSIT